MKIRIYTLNSGGNYIEHDNVDEITILREAMHGYAYAFNSTEKRTLWINQTAVIAVLTMPTKETANDG